MTDNTEGGKRDLGISSRRRFLTLMLTAGAATMLAGMLPGVLTNNSSESTIVGGHYRQKLHGDGHG